MRRILAAVAAAFGPLLLGAGPAELMLCFHRDGSGVLEPFQTGCCESECPTDAPSDCPDEDCRDVPLATGLDGCVEAPSIIDAAVCGPLLADVSYLDLEIIATATPPPPGALDPPDSRPLDFLRTVLLRP